MRRRHGPQQIYNPAAVPASRYSDRVVVTTRTAKRKGDGDPGGLSTKTVRVRIYIRIFTDEEHQPFSLDAQQHRLRAFISSQQGWALVPTGRMLVQLLGVFAEFERATIIDRVINGMERKAARGAWLGGRVPYGLTLDDEKRLCAEPAGFPLIERVFNRYAHDRVGTTTIAAELNADGHCTRMGRPWGTKDILDVLRNRSYLGEVFFRDKWYTNGKEPFLDPALFERAQDLLDERGEGYAERFGDRHPEYVLAGLITCKRCKGKYVGACTTGKRHRYRYYVCSTRQRYGISGCSGERVRADELERAVLDALVDLYADPRLLLDAAGMKRELT